MRVLIVGGHGGIGLRLTRVLRERGDEVVSLVRNPDHAGDVRAAGAEPLVLDLEAADVDALASALGGVDATVFSAGAGPGSGPARKETMDFGGAAKLIAAAERVGVRRFVMVSSLGADAGAEGEGFAVYLRAKGRADDVLRESGLDFTIIRPGGLTDEPGTGRVRLAEHVGRGSVSRDDVAAVLADALHDPAMVGRTLELVSA